MTEAQTQLQSALADLKNLTQTVVTTDIAALQNALESVADAAATAELLGLQDCALLLQQNIGDATDTAPLSDRQLAIIQAWPDQIDAYLHSGRSAATSDALIDSLKQDCWPTSLAEVDTEVLREMLVATVTGVPADQLDTRLDTLTQCIAALDDDEPATLQAVISASEHFAELLNEAGLLGLQDCALLLQQNLEDIATGGHVLTDPQKTLLTAWSGLVRNIFKRPDDTAPCYALVKNLSHPHWPSALGETDADVLYEIFGLAPPLESGPLGMTGILAAAAPTETETDTESEPDLSTMDSVGEVEPALARFSDSRALHETDNPGTLSQLTALLAKLANTAAERNQLGLQDVCLLLQQQLEDLLASDTNLNAAQISCIEQWIAHVRAYLSDPDGRAAAEGLLECMTDHCWTNPLDDTDITILREMLTGEPAAEAESDSGIEETDSDVTPSAAAEVADPEITPDQAATSVPAGARSQPVSQELIDMLVAEAVQIHEESEQLQTQLQSADCTDALRYDGLSQFANRIGRFAGAAQAAELIGLQQACETFQTIVQNLAARRSPLSGNQTRLLNNWPELVSAYLADPANAATGQALIATLQDDNWPQPLPGEPARALAEQLSAVYISDTVVKDDRLQTATAEDVSLSLPDDINQTLLEGLLEELPGQTEHFSEAIQALASGHGNKQQLERAQRVAHTIKGAANTVGVRGIATLTHQIEDLLVILVEHDRIPSPSLTATLVEAADCLEEMSENLGAQRQETPAGAVQTLQSVLDWVNRLERNGIETMEPEAPPPAAVSDQKDTISDSASERTSTEEEEEQTQVAMLRVPATLIDDLLRMVGETQILTAQLQEKIKQAADQNTSLLEQHELFRQLVGELEQQVDVGGIAYKLAETATGGEFDTLELEQYNELHTITHRLVEAAVDSQELDQDIGQYLSHLDELLIDQSRLQRDVQDLVMRTRMVPIKSIVPRLQRAVRQTCRVTGKQADLYLEGTDTLLDSDILNAVVDPLMHILRNAVDHGIESREDRIRREKPTSGSISLHCGREGTQVIIRCRDDGAGLDGASIRAIAEQHGLIESGQVLSNDELYRLILRPGFSTRTATTQTSGRGIGMDIVSSQLQTIKGSLFIDSAPGQGTEFELRLPISLMTTHGLLVRVRKQVMAISTRGIIRILHPDDGECIEQDGGQRYRIEDEEVDLYQIDDLLRLPRDRRSGERRSRPGLLIREEALDCVVQIEQMIDSRDLVVKPLGPYLKKIRGIVGATILGDGSVVPVLDLPELIRTPQEGLIPEADLADTGIQRSLPVALIVDDSISARRTLAQIIRDAGYDVRTAKDGLEAAGLMEKKRPDIVLTDLEMPRMNGFELASHIRANETTVDIPIMMVTSRSTEKHRQLASKMGIDVYLTKPFSEDTLLLHVHELLERSYAGTN